MKPKAALLRPIRCYKVYFMLITLIIFFIVIVDQVTKHLASLFLMGGTSSTFLPGILSFRYHENPGAAWGILQNQRWIFMIISTIAIFLFIGYLFYTRKEKTALLFRLSLAFFIGGGIGNMIDRVRLGYVVDFLRFDFIDFPIFNVADSFISIGAGLMVLHLLLEFLHEQRSKKINELLNLTNDDKTSDPKR